MTPHPAFLTLVLVVASGSVGLAQVVAPSGAKPVAAHAEPAGMERLINGRDLAGWDGDPRLWSVKDGVIRGETTPERAAACAAAIVAAHPYELPEVLLAAVTAAEPYAAWVRQEVAAP